MTTRRQRGHMTEKELAAELQAHRLDPDEWEEVGVQAQVSRERSVLMSFRLPTAEFIALQKAANESRETLSEFVRIAIGLRLHGQPVVNAIQIVSGFRWGTVNTTFVVPALSAGRSENPLQKGPDPDRVPRFDNVMGPSLMS
jgi:hypothetical protein